jgi:hypothetical protein
LIGQQDIRQIRNIPLNTYKINFLEEDKDIQFDQKISPLLCACYVGKVETVLLLLNNETIDVNLSSFPEGYTPLMVACFKGYYEIVRLLLEKNADVCKTNSLGQMPILFCFSRLEENYYKYENKKICMMMVDLLLMKGSSVNIRIDSKLGYTILMKLASTEVNDKERLNSTLEIIQFLMERGADLSIKGFDKKSIFDVIKPGLYAEYMIDVIKNTKQTIFYNKLQEDDGTAKKIVKNKNSSNKGIIVESSEMRMNCCSICKHTIHHFHKFSLNIYSGFCSLDGEKLNY